MHIFIGDRKYNIVDPFSNGREGEIYVIEQDKAVKIYYPDMLSSERKQKVLALRDSYAKNKEDLKIELYVLPEFPVYDDELCKFESICGFSMRFVRDRPLFSDIGYDLSTQQFKTWNSLKLDDEIASKLIFNTFNVVKRLHQSAKIIIGDVNPTNIFYDSRLNSPIIIDLDSAQFGQFPCVVYSEEYIDPLVQQQGKRLNNSFVYSTESDIFSLACICFELFVGVNPFFLRSKPPFSISENKRKGISVLQYFHEKTKDVDGVKYLPISPDIKSRIQTLRKYYPELFNFFLYTFVYGQRINLMQTIDQTNSMHTTFNFESSREAFEKVRKEILGEHEKVTTSMNELNLTQDASKRSQTNSIQTNYRGDPKHQTFNFESSREAFEKVRKEILDVRIFTDQVLSKEFQPTNKPNFVKPTSEIPLMNEKTDHINKINEESISKVVTYKKSNSANKNMKKLTDSDQLAMFLKNYLIDISDIRGS